MANQRRWLPQNRVARVLVVLLLAVGTLEVVYLLVANVALAAISTRFARNTPVGVSWDRAFTLYPGRISARGLRVVGDGWNVAASECDASFDVLGVVTEPRRVRHVTANVTAIELASKGVTRRFAGTILVDIDNASIDGNHVAFDAHGNVQNARIESGGETLASDLAGTLTATGDAMTGAVDLNGKMLSIAPLASFASLTATQDVGTLRVSGSWKSGVVQPASELRAETANAMLKDAKGASATFPRGLVVRVGVAAADPRTIRLDIQVPRIVFAGADATEPPDELETFELGSPAGSSTVALDALAMRSVDWSAERVSLHEGAKTITFKAGSSLHFEVHETKLVADSGSITASNVVVDHADATDRTPFDARIALTRMTISREDGIVLDGHMHASGNDAKPMIELFVKSPSIRSTLAPLESHAFTADATIARKEGRLSLDDLELVCSNLTARGGYRRRAKESRAAFVVSGGPLPVGISQKGAKESIVLSPKPTWVASELEEN